MTFYMPFEGFIRINGKLYVPDTPLISFISPSDFHVIEVQEGRDANYIKLSFDAYVKKSMKSGFEVFKIGTYKDEMFTVFHQINTDLWRLIEKGELNLDQLQKKRWNMIFERLGISADGITEAYLSFCQQLSA
jgi:hypothetical protein